MSSTYTLATNASLKEISTIAEFITSSLTCSGVMEEIIFAIELAVDEITNNIMMYAYPAGEGTMKIMIDVSGTDISIEIRDQGKEFNPLLFPPPDISSNSDERKIGGLGIHMVRSIMDKVNYERRDGQNILKLNKSLSGTKP